MGRGSARVRNLFAKARSLAPCVVFIDEIDKVAVGSGGRQGPDISREGVQRDLLPIVEGSTVQTKHGPVSTDHILFVAAGAYETVAFKIPNDTIDWGDGMFVTNWDAILSLRGVCKMVSHRLNQFKERVSNHVLEMEKEHKHELFEMLED